MTVRVEWTATALLNLADILDYVRRKSSVGADLLVVEIRNTTGHIAANPKLYRTGRVRGTREAVVTENYLMVYRVVGDVAQILNVLHAHLIGAARVLFRGYRYARQNEPGRRVCPRVALQCHLIGGVIE